MTRSALICRKSNFQIGIIFAAEIEKGNNYEQINIQCSIIGEHSQTVTAIKAPTPKKQENQAMKDLHWGILLKEISAHP